MYETHSAKIKDHGVFVNVSFLFDASMGLGTKMSFGDADARPPHPSAVSGYPCGYAGGIGANNVSKVLEGISALVESEKSSSTSQGSEEDTLIWIDMESSLRCIAKAGSRGDAVLEAAGASGAEGAADGAREGCEDLFSCDSAFCCARVCEHLIA